MIIYYNEYGNKINPILIDSDIGLVLSPDYHFKIENDEWFIFINQHYIDIKSLDSSLEIINHVLIKHKQNIRTEKLKNILDNRY